MSDDGRAAKTIFRRTPELAAMLASVRRAMAITARLNRLTFDDADEIRTLFSQLIGQPVDASFRLIPPFYATGGEETRVGRNVFVNQNCTFYDLGGLDIGDDVMIGPNVSLIAASHPLEPAAAARRDDRPANRHRASRLDRRRRDDHRRGERGRKRGGRRRRRGHPRRPGQYAGRRKSGPGDPLDRRRLTPGRGEVASSRRRTEG